MKDRLYRDDIGIKLLYIFGSCEEVVALFYAGHRIVVGVFFNFNIKLFQPFGISRIENWFEIDLATGAQLFLVFDVENRETVGLSI